MAQPGIIRRYTLEIEKIDRGQFPSFREIRDFLFDHGFEVSDRTIQRDIEQIRFEFGIEIKYDRDRDGYYIDTENSLNIDSFFRFLEIVNTAELFTESLHESKVSLNYISFDKGGGLKGIENLRLLLKAIKERRKISFNHFNFHREEAKTHRLDPYLLKEYQNRWYVIGKVEGIKEFRTFGIDRIENLEISTEIFQPDLTTDPAELFDRTIGLYYSENPAQKIILSFTPKQGKYVKTLPWHASQKILEDTAEELRISLFIVPNFELMQLILKHGDSVKVLEPKFLADDIQAVLKRTLERY